MQLIYDNHIKGSIRKYFRYKIMSKFLLKDRSKYYEYFFNIISKVENSNVLVRLINDMVEDIDKPIDDILTHTLNNYEYTSRVVGFVTPYNRGHIDHKLIDNNGNMEIIFINDSPDVFDIDSSNWFIFTPLTLFYTEGSIHSLIDIYNLKVPFGNIYQLDVKTLIMQYVYWARYTRDLENSIDPAVYVRTMVLPKLLDGFITFRGLSSFLNLEVREITGRRMPFITTDRLPKLDKFYSEINIELRDSRHMNLNCLLKSVPVLDKTLYDFFLTEQNNITRHNIWIYTFVYGKILLKILDQFPYLEKSSSDILKKILFNVRAEKYMNSKPFMYFEDEYDDILKELEDRLKD